MSRVDLLTWITLSYQLSWVLFQVGLLVFGFWIVYDSYADAEDDMDTTDNKGNLDADYEMPLRAKILYVLMFWPTDWFINLPYVRRMFVSKYSIILLIPLMLLFPFFFWGTIIASVLAALAALGVL